MDGIFQYFNGEELLKTASSHRPGWGPCHFLCSSADLPDIIKAGDDNIMILAFTNNRSRWAIRLPREFRQCVEYWAALLIHPLQSINETLPNIPAPRIHSYSISWDSPVGVPYVMMDWNEGREMPAFTDTWPSPSSRHKILDQLSDFLIDMIYCPLDGAKGSVCYYGEIHTLFLANNIGIPKNMPQSTSVSTSIWLLESVDRALRRNLDSHNPSIDVIIVCLIQRAMVPDMIVPEFDDAP
jgi:hypothetical protein